MKEVDEVELVVERVAALDLGKAGLEACVADTARAAALLGGCRSARLWHDHRTDVGDGGLVASLAGAAGGDGIHQPYWKGVYYLLGGRGI